MHERAVARILAEEAPALLVSLSSDVSPIWREYERANTVAVNAYVQPAVSAYMAEIARGLQSHGYRGEVVIMQSNGGRTGRASDMATTGAPDPIWVSRSIGREGDRQVKAKSSLIESYSKLRSV